jgi:uncharacterized protein (TIGR02594 family)
MRRIAFAFLGIFALTSVLGVSAQPASATGKKKATTAAASTASSAQKKATTVAASTASSAQKKATTAAASTASSAQKKVKTANVNDTPAAHKKSKIVAASAAASSDILNEAQRWLGTNPTGMSRVWCARFMNFVLERSGYEGTGSDAAASFAKYGRRILWPQVGAIAVMTRGKNGGHVGVVTGVADDGRIVVLSGNHNKRVGIGHYPPSRIYAYVVPVGGSSSKSSLLYPSSSHPSSRIE